MSESDPAARRARPSGREARQKARAQRPVAPAYITRELPPYELLSPEGLDAIERHADILLEEIGFEIRGDAEAIALWRKAGAKIAGDWRIRSEEHTSELQSHSDLVCRLLLEKKKAHV